MTAHAYLLYPDAASLTREAASRLRALADYTELGSGLRIAMRDLEIRGAGNLLGDEQSGHVAAIGFELYLEMLNDAVLQRAGARSRPSARCGWRSRSRRTSPATTCRSRPRRSTSTGASRWPATLEEVAALRDEIEDRFGPVPPAGGGPARRCSGCA